MQPHPPTRLDRASALFQHHHVAYAGLYGSRAKGTARPETDVDVLIEFEPGIRYSLFDLMDLKDERYAVFAAPVDLKPISALNPHTKQEVLHTVVPLYDRR